MMPESEALIESPQLRPERIAIQPKKRPAERSRAERGPTQQSRRHPLSGKLSPDRKAMNKSRLFLRDVGPEEHVFKLKPHDAGRFSIAFGQEKQSGHDVRGDVGR